MPNLEHALNFFSLQSEKNVQLFLDQYSYFVQLQFVSAIYHGRTHLHQTRFCIVGADPRIVGTSNVDHIPSKEYARLIWEKGHNVILYLNVFRICASNSNFDINTL